MRKIISILCFSVILILTGCSGESDSKSKKIKKENIQLAVLEMKVQDLEEKDVNLEGQVKYLIAMANVSVPQLDYGTFTPSSEEYQVINTQWDQGKFFVSVKKMTKYINGYKVELSIGNPSNVLYNGLTIKATLANGATQTINSTRAILPGRWNDVVITLAPASAQDVSDLKISLILTRGVSLRTDNRSNED